MPRVNNEVEAVAERVISKTLALVNSMQKFEKVKASLAKLDPKTDAELYDDASDHLKRIDEDRSSLVNTILGMHEKSVTRDWNVLREFVVEFAQSFVSYASVNVVKLWNDSGLAIDDVALSILESTEKVGNIDVEV